MCGVSPLDRSSVRRQSRRLNRGGGRQAHAALHRIMYTRLRVALKAATSAGLRRAGPGAKSSVASSATRPGRSLTWSDSCNQDPAHRGCRDR
ncbi:hypothetical protein ACFT7S_16090 [Streptomyces sp. NPDC057136]|uniref:hypothetical protein n=1 Tax=Streptomyces sp. NPDC057136 TaxID=3346029 RepID=UPI0036345BED